MQVFEPGALRRRLDGDLGIRRSLAQSYDEFARSNTSGHLARAHVIRAIQCILVGYDGAADLLLARAREWLMAAIERGEKPHDYVENGTECARHFDLALCNWLLTSRDDVENYDVALSYFERGLKQSPHLVYTMPLLMSAGAYRRALDIFNWSRAQPARSLGRIITEGQMAYVVCRHVLGEQYAAAEVQVALKRFLDRAINHWLLDGQYPTAVIWMKITQFNGHEGELNAKDAILRCYDYLRNPTPIAPGKIP